MSAPAAKAASSIHGRGLTGHLTLVCSADSAGRSYLRRQSFCAPIHLSKPHHEAGALVVNIVNPTAGLLAGDRLTIDVAVESAASLLLTMPSATRAHCTGDHFAAVTQEFRVMRGGWLEWWPELFIPQRGARYRQTTKLIVEEEGELLFTECIAPGRVASGEVFHFTDLSWETDLFSSGVQVARERYRLLPDHESVRALQRAFEHAYYGSCIAVSPRLHRESACWERIHALQDDDAWIGCGPLNGSGWIVKCVAGGSIAIRRTLAAVRRELYRAVGRTEPGLRRNP